MTGDRVEYHRTSWTELESVYSALLTRGGGEAITDPIYFGKCFYDKPLFTYATEPLALGDDPTSRIRDYAHAEFPYYQYPAPGSYRPWHSLSDPEDGEFGGWWPEYGDTYGGFDYNGSTRDYLISRWQTGYSATGMKVWTANVLADFSTVDNPGSTWTPVAGAVSPGVQVTFTTSFKYTYDTTPSSSPSGRITFEFYNGSGDTISTSSSTYALTTSDVARSHSATPPAGAKYVGIYIDFPGTAAGYGTYMMVYYHRRDTLAMSGVTIPKELMGSHFHTGYAAMSGGGFETQPWLGYIPEWNRYIGEFYAKDFVALWVQSPRDDSFENYFQYWPVNAHAFYEVGDDLPQVLLSMSSADNYESVSYMGTALSPPQGWSFTAQIDSGGRDLYWDTVGLRTYFEPKSSSAVLPNDLGFFSFHLDEPHNTQNPWKFTRVRPGDVLSFSAQLRVEAPFTAGQLQVVGKVDCYDSDNAFLGTVSAPVGDFVEGYGTNSGYLDAVTTTARITTTASWLGPSGYPFVIQMHSEKMLVTERQYSTYYTVERGYLGTTPAVHANGTPVYMIPAIGYASYGYGNTARVVIPSTVGGGTPYWATPRLSWIDTSTGDYPEMSIYSGGSDIISAGVLLASGMCAEPQALSEWLLSFEGPEPRRASKVCAYYKFGEGETSSRWLSYSDQNLIWPHDFWGTPGNLDDGYVEIPDGVAWSSHEATVVYGDPNPTQNPRMLGGFYRFGVYSESPVQIELYLIHHYGVLHGWPGYEDMWYPTGESKFAQHGGSGWETFEIPWDQLHDDMYSYDITWFFRVNNATPGQIVKLDNVEHSRDYTNAIEYPEVTLGIAEWIKDIRDLYVGARLWIKVGD